MRTTLTLDEDVAVQVEALRRRRRASLKGIINEALRRGLGEMVRPGERRREPFQTRVLDAVIALQSSLDNVAETLAQAEGEAFR